MININRLIIAKTGYILISITFYITGILCIIFPQLVVKNACILSSIILIVYGIIKIIGYFSKDLYCLAFQYDFACGLFLMVLGVIILCKNEYFSNYLLSGLGLLILLDSLLSIQTTVDAHKFGLTSWPVIFILSILSGTLGIVLIVINSLTAAGCALLAEGFTRHYIVRCTVRLYPCLHNTDSSE